MVKTGLVEEIIRDNIERVRERIEAAARRSGRTADDVALVGVSKYQPIESLLCAVGCGIRLLGESRVQEAEEKRRAWTGENPEWHMIGHLQRNKARKALAFFDCVESVDSAELAEALQRILDEAREGRRFPVFVEVNTSGEPAKDGVHPDDIYKLFDTILQRCPSLAVKGLMTIGPREGDERAVRASFSLLREIAGALRSRTGLPLVDLSMGMSGDFEWAVEEGSTLVRVGTGVFGLRESRIN